MLQLDFEHILYYAGLLANCMVWGTSLGRRLYTPLAVSVLNVVSNTRQGMRFSECSITRWGQVTGSIYAYVTHYKHHRLGLHINQTEFQ